MSLKVFHIFFILVSITLTIGFGVFSIQSGTFLLWGSASLLASVLLVFYLFWFLRKAKSL